MQSSMVDQNRPAAKQELQDSVVWAAGEGRAPINRDLASLMTVSNASSKQNLIIGEQNLAKPPGIP